MINKLQSCKNMNYLLSSTSFFSNFNLGNEFKMSTICMLALIVLLLKRKLSHDRPQIGVSKRAPNLQLDRLIILEELLHKLYFEHQSEIAGVVAWLTFLTGTHTSLLDKV